LNQGALAQYRVALHLLLGQARLGEIRNQTVLGLISERPSLTPRCLRDAGIGLQHFCHLCSGIIQLTEMDVGNCQQQG
jgi:hypothetical protein